jgi:hypothetical protein
LRTKKCRVLRIRDAVARGRTAEVAIAVVAEAVTIRIALHRVRHQAAVVGGVGDAIAVGVRWRIGQSQAAGDRQ